MIRFSACMLNTASPATLSTQRRLCAIVVAAMAMLLAAIGAAIIGLCHGHLIYTYDDPYISLALSQQIAHGHYGLNPNEVSSPSSSILFPFLLACFARFSWQEWVPALLNAVAASGTAALIASEMYRLGVPDQPRPIARVAILTLTLCTACSVLESVYIGLEHSWHIFTCVAVVTGLSRLADDDRVTGWLLVLAIVLLPLWRFEGALLAVVSILALALLRRWQLSLIAALGIGLTLGAYAATMHRFGLPMLPNSVLLKSDVAREAFGGTLGFLTLMKIMLHRAVASVHSPEAWPVIALIGVVAAHPILRALRRRELQGPYRMSLGREALFATVILSVLVAHVLLGAWGRYEYYALATGVMGAVILWHRAIAALLADGSTALFAATVAMTLGVGNFFVMNTLKTPVASLAIFEQQYQMHRFAVDFYQAPVAVNDLGWVSYRNPNYVLDLVGLGSESTRLLLMNGQATPGWVGRLVATHRVGLAMIYDSWFAAQIPEHWRRVAVLKSAHRVNAPFNSVSFYATSSESIDPALQALKAFQAVTPAGTTLTVLPASPVM